METVSKKVSELFNKSKYLFQDDERFGLTVSSPNNNEKKWEFTFCPIKINSKKYSAKEILSALKKSLTFAITVTEDKVVVQINGMKPSFTHDEFLDTFSETEDFLRIWFEYCFNSHP